MVKNQLVLASILIASSFVGVIWAAESLPKTDTASKTENLAARIIELERKIASQKKLISDLEKQLKNEKEKNRKLQILCDQYNIPKGAYWALFGPKKQARDGAVEVALDKTGKPIGLGSVSVGKSGWVKAVRTDQIVDDTNAVVIYRYPNAEDWWAEPEVSVWLKGISTEGIADDSRMRINQMMKITGTTSYTTTKGSKRTLFVMEAVPYYFPKGYNPGKQLKKK